MSVSKWNYDPVKCDGKPCVGDCDKCNYEEPTRLEILKQELEQIKSMRCLAYDIMEQAIKWYENEIRVIEEYGE